MKCKYCGQSAGFFSHAHKECEEKHKQGIAELLAYLNSYFTGTDSISCILSKIETHKSKKSSKDRSLKKINRFV